MFGSSDLFTSVDFSNWQPLGNVATERMFEACNGVQTISFPASGFAFASQARFTFRSCPSLTEIINLGNVDITACTNISVFADASTLTTSNYDSILNGWASQSVQSGLSTDFGGSQYSLAGASARNTLVTTFSWTILDGGAE